MMMVATHLIVEYLLVEYLMVVPKLVMIMMKSMFDMMNNYKYWVNYVWGVEIYETAASYKLISPDIYILKNLLRQPQINKNLHL